MTQDNPTNIHNNNLFCCRPLQWATTTGKFCITIEASDGSFRFLSPQDAKCFCVISWCPFCGQLLSKSPSDGGATVERARAILDQIGHLTELQQVYTELGAPDVIRTPICNELCDWDPWTKSHYYYSTFADMMLIVKEYHGGRIRKVVMAMSDQRRKQFDDLKRSNAVSGESDAPN